MSDAEDCEPSVVENPLASAADEPSGNIAPSAALKSAPPSAETPPTNDASIQKLQELAARRQRRCAERAEMFRQKFKRADSDVAEELLEMFVADEVEVLTGLQDVERTATIVLAQVVENPPMAMMVARLLREVVAVHAAVRGRAERSLAASANLRAQRRFLARSNGD